MISRSMRSDLHQSARRPKRRRFESCRGHESGANMDSGRPSVHPIRLGATSGAYDTGGDSWTTRSSTALSRAASRTSSTCIASSAVTGGGRPSRNAAANWL
jgi:hypothetical protein